MSALDHLNEIKKRGWRTPNFTISALKSRAARYAIVIPVINEGERIQKQLHEMAELGLHMAYDIIIVDGGSTDGSLEPEFLKKCGVCALLTKTGPGKLSAQLRCAYAYVLLEGYDGVITIDGNGKDGVSTIPAFGAALDEGFHYVQASRFIKGGYSENTPLARLLGIRLIHAPILSIAAGRLYTDTTQGYRAYSAAYLRDDRVQPFRDVFDKYELLAYLTVRANQLRLCSKELATCRIYPQDEKIPTKISGAGALIDLVMVVLATLMRVYHPASR